MTIEDSFNMIRSKEKCINVNSCVDIVRILSKNIFEPCYKSILEWDFKYFRFECY
jgi:hypothetical protein